ncbi:MAG TPA: hypothetical protein VJ890_03695 [Vineibacter sp.]|nr:hypothetical protein [Vineibacter sp.]
MPTIKWIRHADFPQAKCVVGKDGAVAKLQLREWAVGKVIAKGLVRGEGVASNLPNIVPGSDATGAGGRIVMAYREGEADVFVYARSPGTATLQSFVGDDAVAGLAGPKLIVEVLNRRAEKEDKVSLATLMGKTVSISAPDAKSYEMEKNFNFTAGSDPARIFVNVPEFTDHVVVCSHGGVRRPGDTADKLCMFVSGMKVGSAVLDVDNCDAAFATLKDKMSTRAVIWLGGCNIGMNDTFCSKAAVAAERVVVAPTNGLLSKKYPKNAIDMLDRFAGTKVFGADGKLMGVSDLCAIQFYYKFKVPI